jgi:zinc transport system substrate-binding protein
MRPALPFLLLAASPALAETPTILADTAPLHSLVAQVTGDLAAPAMILSPGVSPHDAALRASEAQRLSEADIVFWTGPALVPQLQDPIATLAAGATVVALLDSDGWDSLPRRDDPLFASDDHDHDDHDHDHDDHAATDPHAWLDPQVASAWLGTIADTLATADPDNAATYRANATAAQGRLAALTTDLAATLARVAGTPFIVPHDAYQYLERRFGLTAAGAIALSDATAPGPATIAALRDRLATQGIACVLTDPETNPDWVALVIEGTEARTAKVDPDALTLPPGPDLYETMLREMATAIATCLAD